MLVLAVILSLIRSVVLPSNNGDSSRQVLDGVQEILLFHDL